MPKLSNKQTTALISGMSGFLGRHLESYLTQLEIKPIPIPREFLYQDAPLFDLVQRTRPTYIFHLASYGNMAYQKDEDPIVMANYFATWNLLRATKFIDYKAFVHISSSSVALDYHTFYSASKMGAEYLIKAYVTAYGKPIAVVRPSSIIGFGEQKEHLIPTLIRAAFTQQQIPFVSEPTHDLIDVRDVVEALLFIAEHIDQTRGHTYNVSNNKIYTNKQVLEIVEKMCKKFINVEYVKSMRPYDNKKWIVDNSALVKLGWEPEYTLEDSIKSML